MFPIMWPWLMPMWSFMSPVTLIKSDVQADNWDYRPMTEWGQGDLEIENSVKREVATPGRQLGIISDAVLQISQRLDGKTTDRDDIERLERLVDRIEKIKDQVRKQPKALPKI